MKKILIVEDDPSILLGLESALEEEYEIISASDGLIGLSMAQKKQPDLVILDVMLPNKNGFEICREIRASDKSIPILMLTSKKEETDRISGFKEGADDYVTKPFSIGELRMRIKALLRRAGFKETKETESYFFGDTRVEFKKLDAFRNDIALNLTVREFQILKYFIEHEGEVISRNQLLDDIWGYDSFPTTRTVDNYILTLRKKIEEDPSKPEHILTVHTVGYKFVQ